MNNFRFIFFVFLVTILNGTSYCQSTSKIDSEKEELKNYIQWTTNYASQKKFDSANKYAKKAWILSEEINDKNIKASVVYTNAKVLYWQTKTREAKVLLLQNTESKILEDSILFKSIRLMGGIFMYEENYSEALKQYINIEKLVRNKGISTQKDSTVLFNTYVDMGLVHAKVKNIDKAIYFYDKASSYAIDPEKDNTILFYKSTLYEDENYLRKSIEYSLKGIDISIENNFDVWLPSYYKFISNSYLKLGIADSAIYYGKKGLVNNDDCQMEFLYNNIAKGYAVKGNNKKAISHFKKALNFSSETIALEVHESMRDTYIDMKDYEKAIYHNQKYLSLKKLVDSLKIQQQLADITENYESEKNTLEIEILQSKNDYNDIIIKKKNTQIMLIGSILIISIVLLVLILFSYKKQKKHKNLLFIKNRELAQKFNSKEVTLDYILEERIETKENGTLSIDTNQKEKIHDFIKKVIQEEFYLNKNLSLSEFAKLAGTNTTYLSKVINEDYNKSYTLFINELRISNTLKKFEILPEFRKLTIENIADKAGFSSSSAFYNAFKKFTGLTPSYYVKKRILQGNTP